ncbi:MAG TPA: bifunctional homocysteine S-methyltransferase/methylenetetrahydrofolate reductase [Candidatus Limnocylindrales bacterium]|nr:bifunctional homocysteine S-methyltransferase/methylenetetrahydrofolate reductase [Candidatus Limnocylindrales bacterium]
MTPHPSFRERLRDPRPILADGAMGTQLHAHGVGLDTPFDELNLTHPELVQAIHRAYIEAGADLIETNTFGANRFKLAEHGLADHLDAINRAGVALARAAVDEIGARHALQTPPLSVAERGPGGEVSMGPVVNAGIYVAGSVGPLGVALQPYGRLKPEDARAAFAEQIAALASAGADALIFETFTDLIELRLALDAAREAAPDLPIITEMTFGSDDRTVQGHLPGRVAHELAEAGADVVGVNCSGGPAQIARVLQSMRQSAPDARLSAMPNAGYPESHGGRTFYPATVDYFADYALTFKTIGATVIGGCCGTTPKHIAAMCAALDDPARTPPRLLFLDEPAEDKGPLTAERPSELARMLAAGEFVISVEMNPPRSHNFDRLLASARLLRDAGASVLNIADSPTARMRVSPWAVCQMIQSRLGIETILHFPTRGRNLLRVQGDLLGAHALGLRNLFVCMGDPTRIGDYPDAMDQYDIVPSGLIRLTRQNMNHGLDQAGNSIGGATSFTVGCALNMGAENPDKEIEVLRKKIEAGADFALVQPVFEPHSAEAFLKRWQELEGSALKLPLLIGVMPLYSVRHAQFLDNEIPGITIPPAIFQRIEAAGDDAAQEGVRVARELLRDLRPFAQGAYIIPAFGRYELAAQVIEAV